MATALAVGVGVAAAAFFVRLGFLPEVQALLLTIRRVVQA